MAEGELKASVNFTSFYDVMMTGQAWLNNLTTGDGLEITFDPLLLEDDEKEDEKNDRLE